MVLKRSNKTRVEINVFVMDRFTYPELPKDVKFENRRRDLNGNIYSEIQRVHLERGF